VELVANALPQALVLTAIVIGFGLFAFALTLVYRTYQNLGTLNSDEMRLAEPRGAQGMSWILAPPSSSPSPRRFSLSCSAAGAGGALVVGRGLGRDADRRRAS
jgi:hypothetical protein